MRVEPELPRHPKFRRLKRIVGEAAMEFLIALWGHCQSNQRGEFWPGADADYVELICEWDGERGVLFKALKDCGNPTGFIVPENGGIRVHDWADMNARTVANWSLNANGRKGKNPTGTQREPYGSGGKKAKNGAGSEGGSEAEIPEPNGNPMVNHMPNPTGIQGEPKTHSFLPSLNPSEGGPGETGVRYDLATKLIEFLNAQTGAKFRGTHGELTTVATCLARVGNDVAGCQRMIARQCALWKDDPKSAQWLRPTTLFDDAKFDGYYAQRELALPTDKKNAPNKTRAELLEELTQARATGNGERIRELQTLLSAGQPA